MNSATPADRALYPPPNLLPQGRGEAHVARKSHAARNPHTTPWPGQPTLILWDLVGSCNLRCPSCPAGSMAGVNPRGLISDDLFERILDKLANDFPHSQLHFYNWTEPLIHPRIVEYCSAAAEAGFHVHLSSNLNYLKAPERLMNAGIKTFRISLSGFTQAVYEVGHRGGRIERVRENMIRLSEAQRRALAAGSRTRIHVYYHKYRHNLHELPLMRDFANELGFEFRADWAFLMPVEKLEGLARHELSDSDLAFAEAFMPPPSESIAYFSQFSDRPCELIDQLVIDFQGRVMLCCAVYDAARHFIGNYLDMDWAALQAIKYRHSTCTGCTKLGAHVLYTHFDKPEFRAKVELMAERSLRMHVAHNSPNQSIPLPVLARAGSA